MAIEAGGKNGIIAPDKITGRYVRSVKKPSAGSGFYPERSRGIKNKPRAGLGRSYASDKDAKYVAVKEYDCRKIEPLVACPSLPSNVKPARALGSVNIDQVVIGSCTNGRTSDLRIAAKILRGKNVKSGVRLIVIPATQKIYMEAVKEGLAKIFIEAGGVFSTPTCGPCLGGHVGILAEGEKAIATTNRNFVGRMGHPKSEVYLSNPAVAAASALAGHIAHPEEVQ
jgi:3-isopropylmalate/(R)-2-methylmalate dehydratase large subunit